MIDFPRKNQTMKLYRITSAIKVLKVDDSEDFIVLKGWAFNTEFHISWSEHHRSAAVRN